MLSVLSRPVSTPRASRLACRCTPRSSPTGAALVDWALSDGATVSSALAVNATADGLRGVVATRDVAPGEVLIALPPTCTAFSAASAQAEPYGDLGATLLEMHATGDTPCDEAVLAAWLCLAWEAQPGACALRAYAHALPEETPDLPALWPPHVAEALLPWYVLDALDDSRSSFSKSMDAAAAILQRLPRQFNPSAERLQWAVAHVRARAVRYNVRKASGELAWSKCLMPIVDTQNHATSPLGRAEAAPVLEQAGFSPQEVDAITTQSVGPATSVGFSGGGASWVAARPIPAHTQVTWTYGPLSNVQLLMQFGFVPSPALHAGSVVELTIPESVILGALARHPVTDAAIDSLRRSLLTDAGALNMQPDEQIVFEVKPCAAPETLMAVCGAIALRTDQEWRLYSATGDGDGTPAGVDHAARTRALASSVLDVAAQRWCGDCPPQPDELADDTLVRRAAAAQALWQATIDTLRTAAVATLSAAVPRLQTE